MWRISRGIVSVRKILEIYHANVQTPSCEPLENAFQKTRDMNRCHRSVLHTAYVPSVTLHSHSINQKGCLLAELEGISLLNITRLFFLTSNLSKNYSRLRSVVLYFNLEMYVYKL